MSERVLNDRYRVEELLGRGGVAAVWRGYDLRLDRAVAIKMLAPDSLSDPTLRERFQREARTIARLEHPNIVAVYDIGTDGHVPYLVLALVEGGSLARLISQGPMPIPRALDITAQTCAALAAAHAAGVVHRDIKPANILLTQGGRVQVCDFGIAHLQHAPGQPTLTGPATAIGTSLYMAPEQATAGRVDARTDLYALGCVLYQMLTGYPPFNGGNAVAVLLKHVNEPPPSPRAQRPDIPPDLDELIRQLLAKDPDDRPASAQQLMARLSALRGAAPGPQSGAPAGLSSAQMGSGQTGSAQIGSDQPGSGQPGGQAGVPGPSTAATAVHAPMRGAAAVPVAAPLPQQTRAMAAAGPQYTRAMPLSGGGAGTRRAAAADPRPRWLTLMMVAAGIVALLALVVVSAKMFSSDPPRRGTQVQATPPTGGQDTTSPDPGATEESSAPTDGAAPAELFAALKSTIQQQIEGGQLNPGSAKDLNKRLTELQRNIARNELDKAAENTANLRKKFDDLRDDRKLGAAGYDAIVGALDQLAAALPKDD